jgi:hypothetical protein
MKRKRSNPLLFPKLHHDIWNHIISFLGFTMTNFAIWKRVSKFTHKIAEYQIPYLMMIIDRSWIYDDWKDHIPKIRQLFLQTPSQYDKQWGIDILIRAVSLRYLQLSLASSNDDPFPKIKIHLPKLQKLKFYTHTPDLQLWNCPNVTQLGFRNTSVRLTDLEKWQQLSILKIKFLNHFWYERVEISPTALFPVLRELVLHVIFEEHVLNLDCFPMLETFDMRHCDNITIKGTKQIPLQNIIVDTLYEYRDIDFIFTLPSITSLQCHSRKHYNLQLLTNLTQLDLSHTRVNESKTLASLTRLTHLNLFDTNFSGPVFLPCYLTYLDLSSNPIPDVSQLVKSLTYLDISDTFIRDLEFVSDLTNLIYFDASTIQIRDLCDFPISIQVLKLSRNRIQDMSKIGNLSSLRILEIDATDVSNINVLYSLNLTHLKIYKSLVSFYDISCFMKHRTIEIDVKVHDFRSRGGKKRKYKIK